MTQRGGEEAAAIVRGPRNDLGDVAGIRVGHAEDPAARTGVTVVLPEDGALLAAVDVRGGAPGTVNTAALAVGGLITELHGLTFAGGSVFGLEAATGLTAWLAARGRGFTGWGPTIPLVAGCILFDLANGGVKDWGETPPYRRLSAEAAERALERRADSAALGKVGAGYGAVAGPIEGGLGAASAVDGATGITLAAMVAVNAIGSTVMPSTASFYAWHLELGDEAGGQPPPTVGSGAGFLTKNGLGTATTIGALVTDADLSRSDLQRLAIQAQAGLAMAIRPAHALFDGDTIFALSTRAKAPPPRPDLMIRLGIIAGDVTARAVMRGVYHAKRLGDLPSYRELHGRALRAGFG